MESKDTKYTLRYQKHEEFGLLLFSIADGGAPS